MPKLRSAETMDKPKPQLTGARQSAFQNGARLSQPQRLQRQDTARPFRAVTSSPERGCLSRSASEGRTAPDISEQSQARGSCAWDSRASGFLKRALRD